MKPTNSARIEDSAAAMAIDLGEMVGVSRVMRDTFERLDRAAATDSTVLIGGETGTGKEMAARALHGESPRRDGPFVVVDCGALQSSLIESELFGHERGSFTGAADRRVGAFEEASGGTIFLDEIGEIPLDVQPKLLRVLEQREIRRVGGNQQLPVDVRVVAATNRDLTREVARGRFRSDLYFRLAVVTVWLPPLRERTDDIPALVDRILTRLGARGELADRLRGRESLAALARGSWPGNVRELRNHLEACLVFETRLAVPEAAAERAPDADAGQAPATNAQPVDLRTELESLERARIVEALEHCVGNQTEAARRLGISRRTLISRLEAYDIPRPRKRRNTATIPSEGDSPSPTARPDASAAPTTSHQS
jgi:DNA-binding NtrC family response regulator